MEVDQTLQKALKAHRLLLNEHLAIWKNAEVAHAQDSQVVSAASNCRQRTEQMIQQCAGVKFPKRTNETHIVSEKKHKRSEDSEDHTTSKRHKLAIEAEFNSAANSPVPTGPRRIPVTNDPSGLFQIDSNPGDVDILMKNAEKLQEAQRKQQAKQEAKSKRRHEPDTEEVDVPLEVEGVDRDLPTSKRKKAKHSEIVQEPVNGADEYDAEFEQKVALRLKEKDEDRKKKANKKRKRESEASVEEPEAEVEVPEAVAPRKIRKPRIKKGKSQPAVVKETVTAKSPKGGKSKKQKNKGAAKAQDSSQQKPKRKKQKKSA